MEEAGPEIHRWSVSPIPELRGPTSLSLQSLRECARPAKRDRFPAGPLPSLATVKSQSPGTGQAEPEAGRAPLSQPLPGPSAPLPPPSSRGAPFAPGARPPGEGVGPGASLPAGASRRPPPAVGLRHGSPSGGRRCGASLQSPGACCVRPPPPPPPPRRRRVPPPSSLGGWEAAAVACCASAREGGGREEAPGATAAAEPHGQRARRGCICQRCGAANKGEQRRREVGRAASGGRRARSGGGWSPHPGCARGLVPALPLWISGTCWERAPRPLSPLPKLPGLGAALFPDATGSPCLPGGSLRGLSLSSSPRGR